MAEEILDLKKGDAILTGRRESCRPRGAPGGLRPGFYLIEGIALGQHIAGKRAGSAFTLCPTRDQRAISYMSKDHDGNADVIHR